MKLPKGFTPRMVMPDGAHQHHGRVRMKAKRDPMKPGAEFNMSGPCKGSLHDVVVLGIKLAEEALVSGDKVFAGAVMKRIQTVQVQHEIDRLTRQLANATKKVG